MGIIGNHDSLHFICTVTTTNDTHVIVSELRLLGNIQQINKFIFHSHTQKNSFYLSCSELKFNIYLAAGLNIRLHSF